MKTTTFGVDLAKRVFQVHWVNMETGEINRRQLRREQLVTFFASQAPALVAMEACGSAHYWARRFAGFGHQVTRPTLLTRRRSGKPHNAQTCALWR